MNRWPHNKAYFWEKAPFFRLLLPFAAGIMFYYTGLLLSLPLLWMPWVTAALFIITATLLYTGTGGRQLTFLSANVALIATGWTLSAYNDIRNNASWFGNYLNPAAGYVARVVSEARVRDQSTKLQVNVFRVVSGESTYRVTGKAFVYVNNDDRPLQIAKGDTIILPGNWQAITDAGNPFEFSYAGHCARNDILYRLYCKGSEIVAAGKGDSRYAPFTERAHDWSMAQLGKYLGLDRAKGLLQAMMLGDEINLDEDLRQAYADTGIVHIIAISGGNITVFFMVVAFLLGWIRHRKYTWIKYAVALPIIWFYVLMAGAQPSAMRAAVMFSILAFGTMLQKNKNGLNQLMAAAFALLCSEPAWLFSIGFQLSFIAVLSILLFYKPVYNLLPITGRKVEPGGNKLKHIAFSIGDNFGSVVSMSIAAELLVAPVVMYYFHTYPLMFAFANIAAFIFMGLTLLSGVVLVAVSPVPILAHSVAAFVSWMVRVFGMIVGHLQGVGPRALKHLMIDGYETLVFYTMIAGLTTFILLRINKALLVGLGAACLLFALLCVDQWQRLHQERLIVYNIAHSGHADIMRGDRFSTIYTDTLLPKKINYAVRPAHIGWRAWEEMGMPRQEIFNVNGKSVLVLNDQLAGTGTFEVDYLVLNVAGKPNVQQLLKVVKPHTLVVSGKYSEKQVMAIEQACKEADVAVHNTGTQGAFVISN